MSPLEGPSPGRLSAGGKSIKLCALCASVVSVWLRPKGRAVQQGQQEHFFDGLKSRWKCYNRLPKEIQNPADKKFSVFRSDPFHASLP